MPEVYAECIKEAFAFVVVIANRMVTPFGVENGKTGFEKIVRGVTIPFFLNRAAPEFQPPTLGFAKWRCLAGQIRAIALKGF